MLKVSRHMRSMFNFSQREVGRSGLRVWIVIGECLSSASLIQIKGSRYLIEQGALPHCLVLVGSRNRFELDFTIELNQKKPSGRQ